MASPGRTTTDYQHWIDPKAGDGQGRTRLLDRDCGEELGFCHGPCDEFWGGVNPDGEHFVASLFLHRHGIPLSECVGDLAGYAYNGGVNIRAFVKCEMKDEGDGCLLCEFDEQQFVEVARSSGYYVSAQCLPLEAYRNINC